MSRVAFRLLSLAWNWANIVRAVSIVRLYRDLWAWMLEPVPFPRDHWYEEDRRRLARRKPPVDTFVASGLGVALAISLALETNSTGAERSGARPACNASTSDEVNRPAWRHQETANFRIWVAGSNATAQEAATRCETIRLNLRQTWLPKQAAEVWSPKCAVVVHGNLKSYQQAIGRSRDRSVGLATYEMEKGQILSRRIDLRSDAGDWQSNALPHELTHLVLADVLDGRAIPSWVNEGVAVLSESRDKQNQRAREVRRAAATGALIPTARLLTLDGLPAAHECDAFYGQSAALVAYLIQWGGQGRFLEFVESERQSGADSALFAIYGISDAKRLDEMTTCNDRGKNQAVAVENSEQ